MNATVRGTVKYGRKNPLRLALRVLKKEALFLVRQRGGIWIGTDLWVTHGSPEDLIVMRWRGAKEVQRRRVMKLLEATGLPVIKGGLYELE